MPCYDVVAILLLRVNLESGPIPIGIQSPSFCFQFYLYEACWRGRPRWSGL
jgi:hypothetical protein